MTPERRADITFWTDLGLRFLIAGGIVWALIQFTLFMSDMRRDLRQSQVKHDRIMQQADKGLKDHEIVLVEHQRIMERLAR